MSDKACGSCSTASDCQSRSKEQEKDRKLAHSLSRIKHKVVVLSGKGGVGKSSVAANVAAELSLSGCRVGLVDVDVHGPSIPRLFGLEDSRPVTRDQKLVPAMWNGQLLVMSLGFLLQSKEDSVIWRGPVKMGLIRQFLEDVDWGDLDYLIVDCPPGTGDEPLSVVQLLGHEAHALIVTSPQDVAVDDVRRSVNFCRHTGNQVLGIVENMSGFVCPRCGEEAHIFSSGGGQKLAQEMQVPFLGGIPLDPDMVKAADEGMPFIARQAESPALSALQKILEPIKQLQGQKDFFQDQLSNLQASPSNTPDSVRPQNGAVKIAIPLAQGRLCQHFGHCELFALFSVNTEDKTILHQEQLTPPPHEPGVLPRWLAEQEAGLVIAGGMGSRAQDLLREKGIRIITGAPEGTAEEIVKSWLDGKLVTGQNVCDH